MIWFGYAMAWVSCAIATCIGIYYTHDTKCLYVMIIPLFISIKSLRNKNDENNKDSVK